MTPMTLSTPKELATQLGVSLDTLKRWRRLKQGPAWVRVGRQVRYAADAIDAWLAEQSRGAA